MAATITANVTIQSITEFDRVNTHVELLYPEHFVAITMKSEDGAIAVTMTRKHSTFAESVHVGDKIVVSGKFKREQDHLGLGGQVVITNCTIGVPANVALAAARKEKALARRFARLGF